MALSLAIALLPCSSARGQSGDAAAAEALFEQGRELLRAGQTAQACLRLDESQRLDPATGTLLALALCHEAEGKLATAWAEFVDVEARSRNENRADREQVASDHAHALQPRLSTLVLAVSEPLASVPGLELRRDGVALGHGSWNTPVPVDGGEHVVEVVAPAKKPWRGSVIVRPESDAATLTIPVLEDAPPPPPPPPAVAPASGTGAAPAPKRWGTLEWAGVSTAGAGVVALGVGGYFLASALGKKSDSSKDCTGDLCGAQGFADRSSAVTRGNTATAFGIAGSVLVLGGATLFVIGRTRSHSGDRVSAMQTSLSMGAGPGSVTAHLSARF